MSDAKISCDDCRESLSARSDGEAVPLEAVALAHLEECAPCRQFRDDLDAVRTALHGWPDELPPEGAVPRVAHSPRPSLALRRLAAAAVLIGAVAAGFGIGRASAPTRAAVREAEPLALEREGYVVPDRNETYSTIRLVAVERSRS